MAHAPDPTPPVSASDDDPFLWLEEVHGERAMAWVRERNAESQGRLQAMPDFDATRAELLRLFGSKDRIPQISRRGDRVYNLWQDDAHPRGLWRRTTLAEYRRPEPDWEVVLDLDALGAAEGENWVWAGATSLGAEHRRCMVSLSRGGADAHVSREFDLVDKRFVDGGFALPEAKSSTDWIDADTLYVGTDFGPGSMTDSGYPRVIKRWRRGTPLAAATTVFEGEATDVWVGVSVDATPGFERTTFERALDFYRALRFIEDAAPRRALPLPEDATYAFWNHAGGKSDTLLLELRSDWDVGGRRHARGSLLAADAPAYLRGERRFTVLFEPSPSRSLAGFTTTRSSVVLSVLDNVASRLEAWHLGADGWRHRDLPAPHPGTLSVAGLADPLLHDDPLAEHYLLGYTDFLTPDSLRLGIAEVDGGKTSRADAATATATATADILRSLPATFDAAGMQVEQAFAMSADGTRVPYFVVWPAGAERDRGANPTLLYGYGGFEISIQPWYAQAFGVAWFPRGGVLVVANIRGGGEFGPAWHQAAIKANKQRSYDDFIAVAEDVIARKITSRRQLGIQGGSNGGLLVGAVFTQRPDLFNAVVCQVPLLDMKRYHRLLAGASWMAEYGDPDDPADWAVLAAFSPYQRLRPGVHYPEVLFTTSTRDDRVHPGHARKMAARMLAQGHRALYYENIEGGHGGAADHLQRAHKQALEFSFLWQRLGTAAADDAVPDGVSDAAGIAAP